MSDNFKINSVSIHEDRITVILSLCDLKKTLKKQKVGEIIRSPPIIEGDLIWYISIFKPYSSSADLNLKDYGEKYFLYNLGVYTESARNFSLKANFSIDIGFTESNRNMKIEECEFNFIKDLRYPEFSNGKFAETPWFTRFSPFIKSDFYSLNGLNASDVSFVFVIFNKVFDFKIKAPSDYNKEFYNCGNCNKYKNVLNNKRFSDVEIIVDNVSHPAHKVILSAKSPVFMNILDDNSKKQIIEIKNLKNVAVKEMLRFIYTGEVENLQEIASDLFIAASKYDIQDLKNLCEMELIKKIDMKNCIDMIILADSNESKNLKTKAIEVAAKNYDILRLTKDWYELNTSLATLVHNEYISILTKLVNNYFRIKSII